MKATRVRVAHRIHRLCVSSTQLLTTYYLLRTTYYLLLTTYYVLPTTYYLLPTASAATTTTTYYLLPLPLADAVRYPHPPSLYSPTPEPPPLPPPPLSPPPPPPPPRSLPPPPPALILDALLAERFYLLRRSAPADDATMAPAGGGTGHQQRSLRGRDRFLALVLEVALPYLKVKIDRTYTRGLTRRAQSGPSSRLNERPSFRLLMFLYPFLHISYEGSNVLSQWLFMVGASPYFSVSQRLLRQRLNRASELDKMGATGPGSGSGDVAGVRAAEDTAAGSTSVVGQPSSNTGAYIRMALVGAAVCYKALEWWYSTGTHIAPSAVAKGTPAPQPSAFEWLARAGMGLPTPRRSPRRPLSQQTPHLTPFRGRSTARTAEAAPSTRGVTNSAGWLSMSALPSCTRKHGRRSEWLRLLLRVPSCLRA